MKRAVACLALLFAGVLASRASADCCCECGCQAQCCKVCRCVPDKKKVPKITYSCECEDFCVPGPSKICGYTCPPCQDECECGHHHHHVHAKPNWIPTCAQVRTRKKLVKHEEVEEVCSWKWVVEDLCPKCAANARMQKPGENAVADHSASKAAESEELIPVAAEEPVREEAKTQEGRLVSHSLSSSLKRKLVPLLGK